MNNFTHYSIKFLSNHNIYYNYFTSTQICSSFHSKQQIPFKPPNNNTFHFSSSRKLYNFTLRRLTHMRNLQNLRASFRICAVLYKIVKLLKQFFDHIWPEAKFYRNVSVCSDDAVVGNLDLEFVGIHFESGMHNLNSNMNIFYRYLRILIKCHLSLLRFVKRIIYSVL